MAAADLWVQVETGLPTSKLVDRLCIELEIEVHEAVGYLVLLWLAVMEEGIGGDLRAHSDHWIERAAQFRGERGKFAALIRQQHLDGGVVKDWLEKYGKLEAVRAEANRIKRGQRAREAAIRAATTAEEERLSGGPSGGHTEDDRVDSSPSSSSVSVVDSEKEDQKPKEPIQVRVAVPATLPPDPVTEFCDEIGFGICRPVAEGYIRSSRNAAALMATIRLHLKGELSHEKATGEQLGLAVQQYAANNGGDRFSARYFAGFVRDVKKGIERGENRKRNTNEQQHIDAEKAAAREREREEKEGQMVMRFMADNPERYAELKEIAENSVPKKYSGEMREHAVHAQLTKLIQRELES